MKTKIVCVDFQKEFTDEKGLCYRPRQSVGFIKNTLVPYLEERNIKLAEIISDYRSPRPGDRGNYCRPGTWGYESEIPQCVKDNDIWIKCMNSPIWVRDYIGIADKQCGLPFQDPKKFNDWIKKVIGEPYDTQILLVGLTLDCCVLCTAQELSFRGYKVKILKEAVDVYSGFQTEKEALFKVPLQNWAEGISWQEAQGIL